jgi:hypothetical protein
MITGTEHNELHKLSFKKSLQYNLIILLLHQFQYMHFCMIYEFHPALRKYSPI